MKNSRVALRVGVLTLAAVFSGISFENGSPSPPQGEKAGMRGYSVQALTLSLSRFAGEGMRILILLCVPLAHGDSFVYAAQETESPAEAMAPSQPSQEARQDRERKITINFPDTDIRVALETLSAKVGVSIIAGPEVKGRVSLKIENMPWEKGLDILLKTYGYSYVWEEGVIRVMSREAFLRLEMQTRVYKLAYAEPLEVQKAVAVVLSKEGASQANLETRTLVVKETPENHRSIQALIEGLDRLAKEKKAEEEEVVVVVEKEIPKAPVPEAKEKSLVLDFINTPIRDAVAQISALSGVYISVGEEVQAPVTLSTAGKEVPWQSALTQIILSSDLAWEPAEKSIESLQVGDFITLRSKDAILAKYEKNQQIAERVDLVYRVVYLKFVDAEDMEKILKDQLTARGKITVLKTSGQKGWMWNRDPATTNSTMFVPERAKEEKPDKSRVLLLSDIPSSVEKMLRIIEVIDVIPFQIIIDTKVLEVKRDVMRDLGLEAATGSQGLQTTVVTQEILGRAGGINKTLGGFENLGFNSNVTPKTYLPQGSGITPVNSGLKLQVSRLVPVQFDLLLHALEEDVGANLLSAPKIMTLNNQEAVIFVGTKYPIVTTEITTGTTSTTSVKLEYYQNIGIMLNVVPQVSGEKFINMILRPTVTSYSTTLSIYNTGGFKIAEYPIIVTREAETQLLMKDGETIVLGGLLQDDASESNIGIPFLSALPFIGPAFARRTTDIEKKDLLIFVTAHIVRKTEADAGYFPSDYFIHPATASPVETVR